jgi:ADP-heptose:LPS heptosyltransferase
LKHIKHYHPDWEIAVECMPGLHEIFNGICPAYQQIHPLYWRNEYPNKKTISFARNTNVYPDCPSTKVTRCLLEEFDLQPIPELYGYEIHPSEDAKKKAARYQDEDLAGKPFAVIHYRGTASKEKKDLTDEEAKKIIAALQQQGLTPVILDWDDCRLADNKEVFNPSRRHAYLWDQQRYGDAGTIAALIQRAEVFFGIDSGPAHLAGATDTSSVVFWKDFHPVTNFDPCPNVLHVLADNWEGEDAEAAQGLKYWEENNKHEYYQWLDVGGTAARLLEKLPDEEATALEKENVADDPK